MSYTASAPQPAESMAGGGVAFRARTNFHSSNSNPAHERLPFIMGHKLKAPQVEPSHANKRISYKRNWDTPRIRGGEGYKHIG